jgi:hypothetical protein
MSRLSKISIAVLNLAILCAPTASLRAGDREALDRKVQPVIDEVDKLCRDQTVYMIGPEKPERLAELVCQKKPKLVVKCGTAKDACRAFPDPQRDELARATMGQHLLDHDHAAANRIGGEHAAKPIAPTRLALARTGGARLRAQDGRMRPNGDWQCQKPVARGTRRKTTEYGSLRQRAVSRNVWLR